jgi:ribonuclease-3
MMLHTRMNKISNESIQKITNIPVNDINIYQQAFCHKSATKELGLEMSNERLEFVGDAVLNLSVGCFLYNKYPYEDEGFLTKMRIKLVSGKNLSKWSKELNLQNYVMMNTKAIDSQWNKNPRILEDTFESLVGAIYLDNDESLNVTNKFIHSLLNKVDQSELLKDTNYKDMLMKYTQINMSCLPEYKCSTSNNKYVAQVLINNKLICEGFDQIKKEAEQKAANIVLKILNII